MAEHNGQNERLILDTLNTQPSMTMERLVTLLPHMTWNRVFQAVDSLSRGGKISVRRCGFDYELAVLSGSSSLLVGPGYLKGPALGTAPGQEQTYAHHPLRQMGSPD